jgi:hypothetical protein
VARVDQDLHDVFVDTGIGAGLILTHYFPVFRFHIFHANLDLIMSLCTFFGRTALGQDLVEKMLARLKRTEKLHRLVEILNSHDFTNHLVFWRQAWI